MARTLRIDSRGRITLPKVVLSGNVTGFSWSRDSSGRIVLEPVREIPVREGWLFQDPDALKSLHRGLTDAAQGRFVTDLLDRL